MSLLVSIVLIILLLIALYNINKNSKSHDFWNKQPVMRISTDKWVNIGMLPNFNIIIPSDISIIYDVNVDDTIKFINVNFSPYLQISNENMKKYLNDMNTTNIAIYKNHRMIGFIHSRPLHILYDNNEKVLNYVEYLCVSKDMRGRNLASILIASLINRMNDINYDINRVYLFKKDGKKHKFISFISSSYLCLKLEKSDCNTNINDFKNSDISLNYNEWLNTTTNYKFSRMMSIDEWNEELKIKNIYVILIHNKSYIIVGQSSKLKECNTNVFDIEYIYNTSSNIAKYEWDDWVSYLLNEKYEYITMNDIANYRDIVPNINLWKEGNNFHYYLYNAKCEIIDKKKIFFTIN
jgi:hypothetical protein